jgi:hypothetical protein
MDFKVQKQSTKILAKSYKGESESQVTHGPWVT